MGIEGNSFYIGATPDDHAWMKMTEGTRKELESKNYEGMKYAPYVEQIATIIEQEIGFRPDLRVASLQGFESFKKWQKEAQKIRDSGKSIGEQGDTIEELLSIMRREVGTIIMQYTDEAWDTWKESIAKRNGVPIENVKRFLDPYLFRVRDRLASEIPVLD